MPRWTRWNSPGPSGRRGSRPPRRPRCGQPGQLSHSPTASPAHGRALARLVSCSCAATSSSLWMRYSGSCRPVACCTCGAAMHLWLLRQHTHPRSVMCSISVMQRWGPWPRRPLNEQSCWSEGCPHTARRGPSQRIPMRMGSGPTILKQQLTSVSAVQSLCGAPRRNRIGDPILTIDAPAVHAPGSTSRPHTTAQVRGAVGECVVRRGEATYSAVSGKSLARQAVAHRRGRHSPRFDAAGAPEHGQGGKAGDGEGRNPEGEPGAAPEGPQRDGRRDFGPPRGVERRG